MFQLPRLLKTHKSYGRLRNLSRREKRISAGGLVGSAGAFVMANVSADLARPLFCITMQEETAEALARDVSLFSGFSALHFPALLEPEDDIAVNSRIYRARFDVMRELKSGTAARYMITASARALEQQVPASELVEARQVTVRKGEEKSPESLLEAFEKCGFTREAEVEKPGQYSRRGGVLDVFSWLSHRPVRIEFFGDTVESIRQFDTESQRSDKMMEEAKLVLVSPIAIRSKPGKAFLTDYLRRDAIVARFREVVIEEKEQSRPSPALEKEFERFKLVDVNPLPATGTHAANFDTELAGRMGGQISDIMEHLRLLVKRYKKVYLFCPKDAELRRVRELIDDYKVPSKNLRLIEGRLEQGFFLGMLNTAVISADELFDRYSQHREVDSKDSIAAEPFFDLEKGEYCVHSEHGICRFRGMKVMHRKGRAQEFMELEFREGAKLYVSTMQAGKVQKYIGGKLTRPVLSKLGTMLWEKKKERVRRALEDIAADLMSIQAARAVKKGTAFPKDTPWQREFEASFPFTETRDQTRAANNVKEDMQSVRPMDRLLAGDVGYGKTEISMRAAFKAVEAGKQVAVLVPTTVLAQQHYNTFRERMADYPVVVEMLSRFRDRSSQARIVEATAKGEIDILIGTHRLLSGDVNFKDIGLVIVDEEQRFGVVHKEHFKRLRKTVDVLTLTATPIPRTLHMALVGVKDISTLAIPPKGRESIMTRVMHHDEGLIREAIIRELLRGGQVFFVHNRVKSIEGIRQRLEEIVPEATFIIGHGQMGESILEAVMSAFIDRKADVLVCTSIIESGLDIPNVNTIFIDDAQNFGLADMHQLRGRVGRYKHQAFAYFFLPRNKSISKASKARLKAIQEFDELGAGFKLAIRDLEIRGAGNLLGREQSGHITVVGYDLYCRLLSEAIKKSHGKKEEEPPEVEIDLEIQAYLPHDYAPSGRLRIGFYRKAGSAMTSEELDEVGEELRDRCGALPLEAKRFLAKHRLRIDAQNLGISYIGLREKWLALRFEDIRKLKPLSEKLGDVARIVGKDFVYVDLPRRSKDLLTAALKILDV